MATNFSIFTEEQDSPAENVISETQEESSGNFSIFGAAEQTQSTQQAQPTAPVQSTMDNLVKNQAWLGNAKTIYKDEKGEDYKGSDKELDYWFRNRHSRLGNDLTDIGLTAVDAMDMSDAVKQAWVGSLDTWDKTESTLGSAGNAAFQAITDPTTLAALVGGLGVGGVAKLGGQKAAAAAAKFAFKDQLQKSLVKQVGTQAAEEFAKKGTSKAITGEVLKGARKEAAKNLAVNRGVSNFAAGAGYMGADDLLRQSFQIDIQDAFEDPDVTETDYTQTALMALAGGLLGGALGGSGRIVQKLGDKKAVRKMQEAADLDASARPKLPETAVDYTVADGATGARQAAEQGQRELEDGGTLLFNIGEVVPLKNLREINDQLTETGFTDLEKVSPGVYKARKIVTLREMIPESPTVARTKTQKILARIKSGISSDRIKGKTDDVSRRIAMSERGRSTAAIKSERQIATNFERLKKTIKDDLDLDMSKLTPVQARLINSALKGNKKAVDELAQIAPQTSKELQVMRGNIASLQDQLLNTGAIRQGSDLEVKILESMGRKGDDAELYLTTSYEKFDNPSWGKEVATREGRRGGTVIEEAKDYLVTKAAATNPKFGAALAKQRRGQALTPEEQSVYNEFMSADGSINRGINDIVNINEEDMLTMFSSGQTLGKKPLKILTKKGTIPEEIKLLMGEYEDPFVNYAKTVSKLNQTIAQIDYEKDIVDLAKKGLISGVKAGDDATGDLVRVGGKLPKRAGIEDPMTKDIGTGLDGIYAYPELADAILNGNEISQVTFKPLQAYLALQGHTRAAKTVWSPTAIARNFLGAGWMSMGAGYMNPKTLGEIPKIMKGLYRMNDQDLNAEMEKGISLGYLQSGTDLGSFRAALQDAGDTSFWNFKNKSMADKKSLLGRAKKANVEAVKFYQSMDDMWKQFAFINEKGNYKQYLLDRDIDPDAIVKTFTSADGNIVKITELDEYAANEVSKHMQNYAGVPQFVRAARLAPAADFLAFTTEIIRTQKNIVKTALKDMKEGRELMKSGQKAVDADGNPTGLLKGQAQAKVGERRLGSIIAAQSAAPALAAAGYAVTGMDQPAVDKNGNELPFTIKEGFEAFDQPWEKGADFLYLGTPEKGKARRINLSYLNPWSKTQDPIRAGIRALGSGRDISSSVDEAFAESVWQPLKETFGFSMLADASLSMLLNVNEYGKPLFNETDTGAEKFRTGVATTLETFEPGFVKTVKDFATSLNAPMKETRETILGSYDIPVGFTRSGRAKAFDEQIIGLSGVKPQSIDVKDTMGFKLNAIKRNMGDSGKTFQRAYQQRTPITSDELIDAYENGMKKEYEYAKEMFDVITKAKSMGLSNQDIIGAITDDGLFSKRLDKKMLYNLVNRGVFIPAPPKMSDIYKWGMSTKKRTGTKPPIEEAQSEIFKVYQRYAGASTGER